MLLLFAHSLLKWRFDLHFSDFVLILDVEVDDIARLRKRQFDLTQDDLAVDEIEVKRRFLLGVAVRRQLLHAPLNNTERVEDTRHAQFFDEVDYFGAHVIDILLVEGLG